MRETERKKEGGMETHTATHMHAYTDLKHAHICAHIDTLIYNTLSHTPTYIHVYIYIISNHTHRHTHTYIHTHNERDGEKDRKNQDLDLIWDKYNSLWGIILEIEFVRLLDTKKSD